MRINFADTPSKPANMFFHVGAIFPGGNGPVIRYVHAPADRSRTGSVELLGATETAPGCLPSADNWTFNDACRLMALIRDDAVRNGALSVFVEPV